MLQTDPEIEPVLAFSPPRGRSLEAALQTRDSIGLSESPQPNVADALAEVIEVTRRGRNGAELLAAQGRFLFGAYDPETIRSEPYRGLIYVEADGMHPDRGFSSISWATWVSEQGREWFGGTDDLAGIMQSVVVRPPGDSAFRPPYQVPAHRGTRIFDLDNPEGGSISFGLVSDLGAVGLLAYSDMDKGLRQSVEDLVRLWHDAPDDAVAAERLEALRSMLGGAIERSGVSAD